MSAGTRISWQFLEGRRLISISVFVSKAVPSWHLKTLAREEMKYPWAGDRISQCISWSSCQCIQRIPDMLTIHHSCHLSLAVQANAGHQLRGQWRNCAERLWMVGPSASWPPDSWPSALWPSACFVYTGGFGSMSRLHSLMLPSI